MSWFESYQEIKQQWALWVVQSLEMARMVRKDDQRHSGMIIGAAAHVSVSRYVVQRPMTREIVQAISKRLGCSLVLPRGSNDDLDVVDLAFVGPNEAAEGVFPFWHSVLAVST